jgi:hypothetical protein
LNSFAAKQTLDDLKSNRQDHLAVEEAFNLALFNIK